MGIMFSIIPIITMLGFILIFTLIIISTSRSLKEWNNNNHSPKLTVPAKVVAKRSDVSHHHNTNDLHSSSFTSYYVTFEVESGDRMELHLNGNAYGLMVEGDEGLLSFQGTRFLDFKRSIN